MRSDTITMEQEIRDLEAELAAVRAERDFARGERDAYRHERDTLASALEEVSRMANSVAIWAFVREVLQEVMGGPQ